MVLQGQSQRSSFGSGYVNYYIVPETVILGNAIKASNPCTVPLFYQTWGKRDGDSQNCGNHDLFCSYEGIQDQLTQSYNTYAYVNQPAKVAPVGEAWRSYSDRNSLFAGDGSHASSKGWFLAACVMFEQIWGVPASASTYTEGDDLKAQATTIVNDGRQWSWPGESSVFQQRNPILTFSLRQLWSSLPSPGVARPPMARLPGLTRAKQNRTKGNT